MKVLQPGGYPVGGYSLTIDIQDVRDGQYFGLDGVGNWQQTMRQDIMTSNVVSQHNAYLDWGGTPQTYDTNGNLADDGSYLYRYDFLNRLREVKLKSTQALVATYEYDAMNRRITKTVSGSTTRFFYDGWHAVEERVSSTVTKQFVYGQTVDEILKMDTYVSGSISATHYYHTDALGSVVAITDSVGAVVERVKYSPYGQPYWMDAASNVLFDGAGNFVNASAVGNPLLFTAARYDAETANRTSSQITDTTGAYYLRNRYLDSDKGRFITRDPIGIWGDDGNLGGGYSYCGNDPVNAKDPSGLKKRKNCGDKKEEDKEEKDKETDKERTKKRSRQKLKQLGLDPDDPRFANQLDNPDFLAALEALIDYGVEAIEITVVPGLNSSGDYDPKTNVFRISLGAEAILTGAELLVGQQRREGTNPTDDAIGQLFQDAASQIILHELVEAAEITHGRSQPNAHISAVNAENRWARSKNWDLFYSLHARQWMHWSDFPR